MGSNEGLVHLLVLQAINGNDSTLDLHSKESLFLSLLAFPLELRRAGRKVHSNGFKRRM